ncbi:ABC transporter permease subunit [Vibrio metschnikovii]
MFAAAWYSAQSHSFWSLVIYAMGGNESAARLSGINVDRVKIGVYAICGLLSALAGHHCYFGLSAQPTAGMGYELDAIAAVVLGGTSLMGGKGRIMGNFNWCTDHWLLNNALNLLDVTSTTR